MTGREAAEAAILEAEKHKALILPNKGKDFPHQVNIPRMKIDDDDDDDFFHATCHVDVSLIGKIRRGEYVDLEKLLVKPKALSGRQNHEPGKVSFVNKDGTIKAVQEDVTPKITNIRKWEQAFRMYATIYAEANPHRSAEIFQYISIINGAATKYIWDNVAYYDYTFRQLMARKPHRSWAKIYNQMWNVALTEPLQFNNHSNAQGGQGSSSDNRNKRRDWRDGCCWKFNKGHCKHGPRCRFEHRCTFCGSYNHPLKSCRRKPGNSLAENRREGDEGSERSHSSHTDSNKKKKT